MPTDATRPSDAASLAAELKTTAIELHMADGHAGAWRDCPLNRCLTNRAVWETATPTPLDAPKPDRQELWDKFTGGEKLAYGVGYRDGRSESGREAAEPPSPRETADAAWEALNADLSLDGTFGQPGIAATIARHRPAIEAAIRADTPAGLEAALQRQHDEVCGCPFDGTDPDCNVAGGVWVGTLRARLRDTK